MSPAKLIRNNRNEFEYPNAKKRKINIDYHDKTINGLIIKLESNDTIDLRRPGILMENDIIKKEILDSITIKNENKQVDSSEKESEQILDNDREKLENLHVKLIYEIPPQHTIENNAGCRRLKNHEKKLFGKYESLRKGTYSLQEDEII
ncbi:transcription termination factor 1-like isoform X1 [Vespula squamosa]|uniref:Transcription termination factor 1-like isoform X1 n=1 Tax=Vespula squamosa TaxID=30214 RepID=A0ABD1ZUD7_VESSQ